MWSRWIMYGRRIYIQLKMKERKVTHIYPKVICYQYYILIIHLSVDGYLGCYHVLDYVNRVTWITCHPVIRSRFLWLDVQELIYLIQTVCLFTVFWEIDILFSTLTASICYSTEKVLMIPFCHIFSTLFSFNFLKLTFGYGKKNLKVVLIHIFLIADDCQRLVFKLWYLRIISSSQYSLINPLPTALSWSMINKTKREKYWGSNFWTFLLLFYYFYYYYKLIIS